jgi:hypothetical protein
VQALDASLLCAKCEYWRSELAFPWRSKEASRAKGPQSLCHFCRDAGHKAPKVARGHPNASNAPPALPPAIQLAVEQSFPAAQEDAEAEAVLIEVLIARRTVGHQGGASSEHECDLMRRALLLCRGDREAALWRRRGPRGGGGLKMPSYMRHHRQYAPSTGSRDSKTVKTVEASRRTRS